MNKKAIYSYSIVLLTFLMITFLSCESTVGPEDLTGIQQADISISNIEAGESVDLYAGQDELVGVVMVDDNGGNLDVTFEITEDGWCLMETHLHLWQDEEDKPVNKSGNPRPGQFDYSESHDCVDSFTYNTDKSSGESWFIAAHAVVAYGMAPYYASTVVESNQGLKKSGDPVDAIRSDPENALDYETGHDPSNFFSLGFEGEIILGFDCPITNGEGDDIRIIEDTWGRYPLESAAVYVSQDGSAFEYLGEADNTHRDATFNIHTVSFFDLDVLGWDDAMYVKIVDTSDPADHNDAADGYDLNAVEALQDCDRDETAWGAGERFVEKGNWGTFFEYTP